MKQNIALLVAILAVLAAICYSLMVYSSLPALIPIHWNYAGQVDGWGDRALGASLMPALMLLVLALALLAPRFAPGDFRVVRLRRAFSLVMAALLLFLLFTHVVTLQAALRPQMPTVRLIALALCGLMMWLGLLMPAIPPNRWMGVRTVWTLSDVDNWRRTHAFAARSMALAGAVGAVLTAALGAFIASVGAVLIGALLPVWYSYHLSRQ